MKSLPCKKISLPLAVAYSLAMAYIMMADIADFHIAVLLFFLWAIGPQFVLLLCVKRFSGWWQCVALAVQVVFAALSSYGYYDTMYVHTDAQGALVFIFLPLWQYVAILPMIVVWRIYKAYTKL